MDPLLICKRAADTIEGWRTGRESSYEIDSPGRAVSAMGHAHKWLMARGAGQNFFLEVLRSFSMTPAERKKVEAGARYFGVSTKRFSLPKGVDWRLAYQDHFDKLLVLYGSVCAIVLRGDACKSEQFCTARCFRLVNTGGFSVEVMQRVQAVVDQAAKLLSDMGFGHLCYGDVYVTQTVTGSSKTLAFYMIGDDRMYIRANLQRYENEALFTFLHEVGHRAEYRFSSPEVRAAVGMLFRAYKRENNETGGIIGGTEPKIGMPFRHKNETFHVREISDKTVIAKSDDPELARFEIRIPINAWLVHHGGRPTSKPFPTAYSMRDPHEFFAEMFALDMMGKLPEERARDIEPILEQYARITTPLPTPAVDRRRR